MGRFYYKYMLSKEKKNKKNREYTKQWKKDNPEKVREQQKRYAIKHPNELKENYLRYKKKKNPNWKPRIKLSEEEKKNKRAKYIKQYMKHYVRNNLNNRRLKLRFEILSRDNFTCVSCGRKPPEVSLEVDHIYPKNKGGKDNKNNYQTLCKDCNIGKGDSILTEFYN